MTSLSLAGKTALVIGGSSGIGKALAHGLQEHGARVAIASRSASRVEAALAELKQTDSQALGYVADATRQADIERLADSVMADLGRLDILIPCQGLTVIKPAEEVGEAEYDLVMGTNMRSVFFTCTGFGRRMLAAGEGSIITIASMAAHRGWPGAAAYAISKHGVVALTKTLAAEWAGRGVRVNAISPGFFMTGINRDKMSPTRKASALQRTPMARFGELEELVGAAVYLASPSARFVTGTVINVDGGYLAAGI